MESRPIDMEMGFVGAFELEYGWMDWLTLVE